jgi:hypothetical protein
MKRIFLITAALSLNCFAQDQTATVDGTGKKVSLHENGTWQPLPDAPVKLIDQPKDLSSAVTVADTTIMLREVNYSQAVTLSVSYKNHTSKRVTGLLVNLVVRNGFGDVLHTQTLKDDASISPGERTESEAFWHWDDNQFIHGEPFDKMWQAVNNNTAKVEVKILKAAFDDGTVLASTQPQKSKKKKGS